MMLTQILFNLLVLTCICAQRITDISTPELLGNNTSEEFPTPTVDMLSSEKAQAGPKTPALSEIAPPDVLLRSLVRSEIEQLLPTFVESALIPKIRQIVAESLSSAVRSEGMSSTSSSVSASSSNTSTIRPVTACPMECRPEWFDTMLSFVGRIQSSTDQKCQYKQYVNACGGRNQTSSCPAAKSTCCPLHCLSEISVCWEGTKTTDICMDSSFGLGDLFSGWAGNLLNFG